MSSGQPPGVQRQWLPAQANVISSRLAHCARKLAFSRDRLLATSGMGWVDVAPMARVRLIGALEVAGAIGVTVPWLTGILVPLTPLAAWGLAGVQIGAIWTHLSRGEREHLGFNVLLLLVAMVVAIGRAIA